MIVLIFEGHMLTLRKKQCLASLNLFFVFHFLSPIIRVILCLNKNNIYDKFPATSAADCFAMHDACKGTEGFVSKFFAGLMAFVLGIFTMVRMTRNMPKKLTDATIYYSPMYCVDTMFKGQAPSHQLPEPAISVSDFMSVLKRMAELEEKANILSMKPAAMPAEKEEMLNAAICRVDALEQELGATRKVHIVGFYEFPCY